MSLMLVGGCAATGSGDTEKPNVDPLESINRPIYQFNTFVDKILFRPVATGYDYVMPDFARTGVSNFFENITYPVVIVNSFLQAEFAQGASDTGRFLVNSTIGIGGLFDPATPLGLEEHREDFGLTFAKWGIPAGPYVVVPLLGPRTFRSGIGTLADIQVNPLIQWNNSSARDKLLILWTIDIRANLLPLDDPIDDAFDPYRFVRDAYLQNRDFLQSDEQTADEDLFEDNFDDGFDEDF
jgi:phospholipid-binding lipoprotein MlaA